MFSRRDKRWILLVAIGSLLVASAWLYTISHEGEHSHSPPRPKLPNGALTNLDNKPAKPKSDVYYDLPYVIELDKKKTVELKGQELFMARQMLGLEAMQKLRPEDFAAYLETLEPGPLLDYLTIGFARHLATSNVAFGKAWLLGLPADQLVAEAASIFVHNLRSEQLEDAVKMIADFRSPVIRRQIADAAVRSAAPFGLAEAQKIILQLEKNAEFKADTSRFTEATATGLVSAKQFTDAASLLLSLRSKTGKIDGSTQQAFENLARNWAISDPGTAGQWAGELKDSEVAQIAIPSIVACWVATDTIKASEWLDTLPASPAKDRGIAQLIKALEVSQPESAVAWASAINDPALRSAEQERLRK